MSVNENRFRGGVCSRNNKMIASVVTLTATSNRRRGRGNMRVGNRYTHKTCKPGMK
mgnify:CR=1 FL=1